MKIFMFARHPQLPGRVGSSGEKSRLEMESGFEFRREDG